VVSCSERDEVGVSRNGREWGGEGRGAEGGESGVRETVTRRPREECMDTRDVTNGYVRSLRAGLVGEGSHRVVGENIPCCFDMHPRSCR